MPTNHADRVPCTSQRLSPFTRVKVDPGQTSFFEGREFRAYKEFSIPQGTSIILKFTSAVEFILNAQNFEVDAGGIRFEAIVSATEATAFTVDEAVIGKNRMLERKAPYATSQVAIKSGGTLTGGTVVEVVRLVSAGSGNNTSTVGSAVGDERGLPAGTYYLKLSALGNATATGVYSIWWEERG